MNDERAASRLELLADFAVLDTPSEEAFDDIVFIAAQTCRAPIALISLLDRDRQWFKARLGIDAPETPIDQSVCKQDIDRPGLLIIPDLTQDDRTRGNPLVTGDPHLRFYAGAPLVSDRGIVIGRLCVIDREPRADGLTDDQQKMLAALARQVVVQLEQKRSVRIAAELARLQASLATIGEHIRRSSDLDDMTIGTAEIVGTALGLDRAAFGEVDAAMEVVTIRSDWTAAGVAGIAGAPAFAADDGIRDELAAGRPLIVHDAATDPRTCGDSAPLRALGTGALVTMPVQERGATIGLFIVQARHARRWTTSELAFLRSVANRLEAGVARHRADQDQLTLNREISHRLKNMLAMVQAIASQTLRRVAEREPIETFERRLMALGTAHDVLMQTSWSSAELGDVLDAVLDMFGYDGRVERTGPAVKLGPRASLSFSLLVHELTTNAAKYGALSIDAGRVAVTWQVADAAGEPTLTVVWREMDGPPVSRPERLGFGSKLIQLGLVGTGGVAVGYDRSGLTVEMSATVDHLILA